MRIMSFLTADVATASWHCPSTIDSKYIVTKQADVTHAVEEAIHCAGCSECLLNYYCTVVASYWFVE